MRAPGNALPLSASTRLWLLFASVNDALKKLARARRHRRQAAALAYCDRRMLADIGISRADLRDAFSEPFWEDPTALLRERALERRWTRALSDDAYTRPRTDRPSQQAI
jgi:uncharacterized protein YjiS (DUF1127 family)